MPLPNDATWKEQQKKQQATPAPSDQGESYDSQKLSTKVEQEVPQAISLQEVANKKSKKLYLRIAGGHDTPQIKQQLSQILRQHHGEMPVYFYFSDKKSMVLAEYQYWVSNDIDLIMSLSQLLGAENISVKDSTKA